MLYRQVGPGINFHDVNDIFESEFAGSLWTAVLICSVYRLGRELEADEEGWLLVMEMYRLAARSGHSRAAARRHMIKAELKLRRNKCQ